MIARDELDEAALGALDEAVRLFASRGKYEDVVAAFEAVEARFASLYEAHGEPAVAQEVRRRVAEWLLRAGIEAHQSPAACEALLARVIELGFSDLQIKASLLTMFCGHFAKRASKRRLLPYLEPLMDELEAEHARRGEAVWSNYLRDCRDIRARIEKRWQKRPARKKPKARI